MEDRKRDHIEMAFDSSVAGEQLDHRFYYEPLLAGHPQSDPEPFSFLNKTMRVPIWVSSMTGGTKWASKINENLARACGQFGMGMGLGSCRPLLDGRQHLEDFDVRKYIGADAPLFANIGIAQIEEFYKEGNFNQMQDLMGQLQVDGLIVHINPLQEWLQPEGDRYFISPIVLLDWVLDQTDDPIIVKEVGHGFGKRSLEALLQRPIAAIDFGANGGTNFSKLEMMRSDEQTKMIYEPISYVGHSSLDMLQMSNELVASLGDKVQCQSLIISGGVKTFLDGYFLTRNSQLPAIYGQAAAFLKHARGSYEELERYVEMQVRGLALAQQFLTPKPI